MTNFADEMKQKVQDLGRSSVMGRYVEGMTGLGHMLSDAYDKAKSYAEPYVKKLSGDSPPSPAPKLGKPKLGKRRQ